jgi:hypothetical protein
MAALVGDCDRPLPGLSDTIDRIANEVEQGLFDLQYVDNHQPPPGGNGLLNFHACAIEVPLAHSDGLRTMRST